MASNGTASNPDQIVLVNTELEKLVSITHAAAGCNQYDLHQYNDNPAYFMFYENRETRELWQDHMNTPHLAATMEATKGDATEFTANEMTLIS